MYTTEEMVNHQERNWNINEIHLHCLDLLRYILKGDASKSVFKDNDPQRRFYDELVAEMGEHATESGLDMAKEEWFRPVKRTKEVVSDMGWVDVDAYVSGEQRMFNEPVKVRKNMPGVTIVLDMVLPYADREENYMKVRHQKIYDLVMKLEGQGYPVRVVAVARMGISELHGKGEKGSYNFWTIVTIKDWSDPIFAGIWGAFKNNRSTNALLNCYMDYVIGTSDYGNGHCSMGDCEHLFPPFEEVCIIDAKYINYKGSRDNYENFINR